MLEDIHCHHSSVAGQESAWTELIKGDLAGNAPQRKEGRFLGRSLLGRSAFHGNQAGGASPGQSG